MKFSQLQKRNLIVHRTLNYDSALFKKEIRKIWEPENKFKIWLDIEIAICEALEKMGAIPKGALKNIKTNSSFNISRIDQIEKEVKHDVIAFLTNIAENVGADSKFIHMGVTSSDIIDTALSIQLKQSSKTPLV